MTVIDDEGLVTLHTHLSRVGVGRCPLQTLSAMVTAAYWLGVEPFEDRFLRPVFRWPPNSQTTGSTAGALASPVPLDKLNDLRRLAAAWATPRKLLVRDSEAGGEVVALAMEAGLWNGGPSVVVEPLSPGVVLVSTFGMSIACISRDGLELVPDPLNNNFKTILEAALGAPSELNQIITPDPEWKDFQTDALENMLVNARTHGFGGILLVDPQPQALGGVAVAQPWDILGFLRAQLASAVRDGVAAGQPNTEAILHRGSLWRRGADALGLLAGTDGAIVFDRRLRLHAFGVHLGLGQAVDYLETTVMDPTRHRSASTERVSGTRHAATISHVHSRPQSAALVISQDGPVSLVSTKGTDVIVTRRFEVLLPTPDA